jgi:hypothetical protein
LKVRGVEIDQKIIRLKATFFDRIYANIAFEREFVMGLRFESLHAITADGLGPHAEEKVLDRAIERLPLGPKEEFG